MAGPEPHGRARISAGQLADALRANNVQAAPGQAKGLYVVSNIQVNTDLVNVAEFRDMVVKREGDAIVRLGDVATVELGRPRPIPAACWTASAPCTSA